MEFNQAQDIICGTLYNKYIINPEDAQGTDFMRDSVIGNNLIKYSSQIFDCHYYDLAKAACKLGWDEGNFTKFVEEKTAAYTRDSLVQADADNRKFCDAGYEDDAMEKLRDWAPQDASVDLAGDAAAAE